MYSSNQIYVNGLPWLILPVAVSHDSGFEGHWATSLIGTKTQELRRLKRLCSCCWVSCGNRENRSYGNVGKS